MMARTLFCPRCFCERNASPIEYDDRFEIHGYTLDVRIHAYECSACGEELADPDDPDLMRPVHEAYRLASGTLAPDEVRAIRERTGLSQVGFATILGMSPATVHAFEHGRPLNIKEDNLIRLAGLPGAARFLLALRGHLLRPGQRPARMPPMLRRPTDD
jgi:putative zinc finger/helix-turn-helix YgiT family protein